MTAAYSSLIQGTAQTWEASGGTNALTLTSLASGAARQGDKGDFYDATYGLPEVLICRLQTKMASAPATQEILQLHLAQSSSATAGTDNAGGLGGTDAALSNPTEILPQLSGRCSPGLVLSNSLGTGTQTGKMFPFFPTERAIIPVVYNGSAVALSGTAGDHVLTITPYYRAAPLA